MQNTAVLHINFLMPFVVPLSTVGREPPAQPPGKKQTITSESPYRDISL